MKNMNRNGMLILIGFFVLFYVVTTFFLDRKNPVENKVDNDQIEINYDSDNYDRQVIIINNLYKDIKILYDVVNNKFKVDQSDVIVIGDITYKRITNFDSVMSSIFTINGQNKYIETLGTYFAYSDMGYYLAGNLVSYQTYYFRGDNTNVYVTDANENEINGII